jgi:hypothetical protein
MSATTIAIDRPACAVCAAWRAPCEACLAGVVIRDELIRAWNHGRTTSLGLGSTLLALQGQPYRERHRVRLTAEEQRILEMFRGPAVPLGERLSERSRAALHA